MNSNTKTIDLSILIATVNGSGSQSANMVIAKTLFRAGWPVATKNIFPSNIAGLPTWFSIRVNEKGHLGRRLLHDLVIAKNPQTFVEDLQTVAPGGVFIFDRDMKLSPEALAALDVSATASSTDNINTISISFREWIDKLSPPLALRKVLSNMIYVGILVELLNLDTDVLDSVLKDQFHEKETVIEINQRAIALGREAAKDFRSFKLPERSASQKAGNSIFIDGNSAAALGALVGGCTVMAWYPITPATSLAESFSEFAARNSTIENKTAVVQTEDELSAIAMAIGAGWAGSRAMTATSGPGLSLMAEAAGLSYFAEIPTVIWDVQRAGPSTGLPTRTSQGDVIAASTLSHGDTEPIVLIPATPTECFEFAELAFDLAEELQTLVIVLSDLDLAMNFYVSEEFRIPAHEFRRGKVLSAAEIEKISEFARYRDVDQDGVPYRTLPGTGHARAAYFTRGSGHTELATYSENGANYKQLLDRLKEKLAKNHKLLPEPKAECDANSADLGLLYFGSTHQIIAELQCELAERGFKTCAMQIRALPLSPSIESFLSACDRIVVLEQNRDGQMFQLIRQKFPQYSYKLFSARQYDGLPAAAEIFLPQILEVQGGSAPAQKGAH